MVAVSSKLSLVTDDKEPELQAPAGTLALLVCRRETDTDSRCETGTFHWQFKGKGNNNNNLPSNHTVLCTGQALQVVGNPDRRELAQ